MKIQQVPCGHFVFFFPIDVLLDRVLIFSNRIPIGTRCEV